ncbi:MAG TPA: hypothetical protein VGD46_20970 [Rhizobacter sp.]
MFNRKSAFAALIALGALAAGSAHAGNVQWSVSVNLPVPVVGVPVYHAPAPVYHAPAPVYHAPAPVVVYRPAPVVVYRPVPVVGHRGWDRHHHHRHHHHGRHHDRRDGWGDRGRGDDRGERWEPGPRHRHH